MTPGAPAPSPVPVRSTPMRLLSFDAYRSFGIPDTRYLKPELMYRHEAEILAADWLLFPASWQVDVLAWVYNKRLFPSIQSYHLGHDKVRMTRALWAAAPAHVPETLILPSTPAALEEILDTFSFPLVLKEPRSAEGRGVALIEDRQALRDWAASHDVLYAQERLPIERDVRVTVVGDQVVAAYWRKAPQGGFHNNIARGGELIFEDVPPQAVSLVADLARRLKIDHAGFDVALVDGHPFILEFNVLFGNGGLEPLGVKLADVIHQYLSRETPGPTLQARTSRHHP
ncbi:ATP-grasp domain-containing protein [Thioalkalivibrio sulfidiphilus]|uniref:ATP-grasp domain-containing protein n=1 Tax=Thioalkalivibrio sulfidiphilus TaxID=1033854 RepID=UPI001E62AB9B|nr:hypothetical protein [Thioalkalivibrio sulfidiphilus]